jgi:hypothetical protein
VGEDVDLVQAERVNKQPGVLGQAFDTAAPARWWRPTPVLSNSTTSRSAASASVIAGS